MAGIQGDKKDGWELEGWREVRGEGGGGVFDVERDPRSIL